MSEFPELRTDELDAIRRQLEQFDAIDSASDETLALIEQRWPHVVANLPKP